MAPILSSLFMRLKLTPLQSPSLSFCRGQDGSQVTSLTLYPRGLLVQHPGKDHDTMACVPIEALVTGTCAALD